MSKPTLPKCLECNKAMEPGFIPDLQTTKHVPNIWHPAPCEKSGISLTGLTFGLSKEHIKVDREKGIVIVAFRCPDCGAIKLVAPTAEE